MAATAYRQVKDEIRKMITSHALPEGEPLPEIRKLSSRLAVNPGMLLSVYGELEREGYAVRSRDGVFAAAPVEQVDELRRRELFREFDAAVAGLSMLSVGAGELTGRVLEIAGGAGFDTSK